MKSGCRAPKVRQAIWPSPGPKKSPAGAGPISMGRRRPMGGPRRRPKPSRPGRSRLRCGVRKSSIGDRAACFPITGPYQKLESMTAVTRWAGCDPKRPFGCVLTASLRAHKQVMRSAINTLQLPLRDLHCALGVLAAGAVVREHVNQHKVGHRRRCLLTD
jgi:hypothetical protein